MGVKSGDLISLDKTFLAVQIASLLCLGLVQVSRPTSGFVGGGHFTGEEILYGYFVYGQVAVHYWAVMGVFVYTLLVRYATRGASLM